MPSIEVKLCISLAAIAALYAFFLDTRKQKHIRLLAARIKEKESDKWQALPWLHRAMPRVGLGVLFRASRISDAESKDAYQRMRDIERRQLVALIVGAASIVILLTGTRYWGWSW